MFLRLDFDESDESKGTLEKLLDILGSNCVDPDNLLDVTLPASLWFDGMQALQMAGSILVQITEEIAKEDVANEEFDQAIQRVRTIYNEIYDSLVRLSTQETTK